MLHFEKLCFLGSGMQLRGGGGTPLSQKFQNIGA